MKRRYPGPKSRIGRLGPILLLATPLFAQPPWPIPDARVRYQVDVVAPPTTPDAGYVAILPSAGPLPARPNVFDGNGRPLRAETLWSNSQEGCALVFQSAPGPFWIYLAPAVSPGNPSPPDSPLHPSLLLFTSVGRASLKDAHRLANEHPPQQPSRVGVVPMIADAQNRFGPSTNFCSYYTGWINIPEAGDIFIGTISQDGSTVLIDGRVAADWPGVHPFKDGLTGTKGGPLTLTKGPHRIQYFQFTTRGPARAQLLWRLPSMGQDALPQTPGPEAFSHSGTLRIVSAESRDGTPLAIIESHALSYMDFADQFVDLFELTAGSENADWKFSDGSHAHGARVLWPVVRGASPSVTLAIGKATSMRVLYPDTLPHGAKVDNTAARRDYAQALLTWLQGNPAGTPWPPAFCEMLPQVIRGGEAPGLLSYLFQNRSADLVNISADDCRRLASIYYDELKTDKMNALKILDANHRRAN